MQAEDELASIGMVIGAAWNGARAFTATSGPGISLMQEFVGLAYFAEIPSVIFDVQRAGPSTGMPTRTQQSDVLAAAYASHGDTKHIVLFPEDPRECFEMAARAFDLADRFQTPVFVLLDLDIGMNEWLCDPFAWDDGRRMDRGKVMTAEELEAGRAFGRYLDVDGDGIAYRTYPGTHPAKGAFFTRGTSRDRYAKYTEQGTAYVDNMERLLRKFETAKSHVPRPMRAPRQGSRRGSASSTTAPPPRPCARRWSCSSRRACRSTRCASAPSPSTTTSRPSSPSHERVFVVEQNRDAQLRTLLMNECGVDPARLVPILHYDGTPITARFISAAILGKRVGARRRRPAPQGRVMSFLPKPKLHHPQPAEERARLHPARLRGRHQHPLRRLRPRLRSAPPSSRPASSWRSRRTASPRCPASAARRRRRTTSWAPATASTPSTAACLRC